MSEDYLAQKHPIAKWNSVRGVWEKPGTENLFCEHWALFSETWPTAGTMQNGEVFELPTQALPTTALGYSSLPTPKARDAQAEGYEAGLRRATPQVGTIVKGLVEGDPRVMLPTPVTADAYTGNLKSSQHKEGSMHSMALPHAIAMLPTPNTMDTLPPRSGEARERQLRRGGDSSRRKSSGNLREDILMLPTPTSRDHKDGQAEHIRKDKVQVDTVARAVFNSGEVLLPTTRTSMKNGASAKEVAGGNPKFRLEAVTNWGRFEAAIRRWEEILGRPAPDPTKPDGKDGAHRLSSSFTEWMMGVPEGWITDAGLTRNEELKACGNGVVPQQAELALRMLIGDDF